MIQMARKKIINKSHLWISIWASGTQHLVLYVSQKKKGKKKKKEENWTLSLNIKHGMIVSNQEAFKEGENEVVSWTS